MHSEEFRTGMAPVFAGGQQMGGWLDSKKGATNVLTATNAFVTTDDVGNPLYRVHASRI